MGSVKAVKDKLNEFCKAFDEVDEGFLMSRFFGDILFEKQYNDLLLYLMDYNRANELFRSIKDACNKNYVYLCSDNFEIEEVMSLLK